MKYTFNEEKNKNIFYLIFEDLQNISAYEKDLKILKKSNFKFENATSRILYYDDKTVIFVAMKDLDLENLKLCLNEVYRIAKEENMKEISIEITKNQLKKEDILKTIAEIYEFNTYEFNKFKSDKKDLNLDKINILGDFKDDDFKYLEEASVLGKIVNNVRILINEPSSKMYPETFVDFSIKMVEDAKVKDKIKIDVYEKEDCEKFGMNCYLAVAKGSTKAPKLLVMRYMGDKDNKETLALVGKGITYDSGGYSIKTTKSMLTMKCDMSGAATVMGAITAIAKANMKINIVAISALCENAVSGNSYKPGDIYKSMNGKSVFIGNTDAEGRVTLIDAITYAIRKENATKIIDIATLTGAAVSAVGSMCAVVMTNDDDFLNEYQKCAKYACEYTWKLPNFKIYKKYIKHHEADLTNTTNGLSGAPGTITAGMFLEEFVENIPWIHVDFAGPAQLKQAMGYYKTGATGYGVKTFYELAKKLQNK